LSDPTIHSAVTATNSLRVILILYYFFLLLSGKYYFI
jgi:hypothetical protein